MGKLVSKLKSNPTDNEEEQEIRKYEEHIEENPFGYGLQDTEDLRKIKWWQYLIFDLRFRIAYALIVAIILGIAVPIVLRTVFYNIDESTIYGSCLIKDDARFQCLINNAEPATRKQCVDANCCWEENDELAFKCFHTLPSAYQYHLQDVKEVNGNGTPSGDWIQLSITPNHANIMSDLTIWLRWVGENEKHLNLQIFNPQHYPERQVNGVSKMIDNQQSMEKNGITINYGNKDYFFIQVVRNGSERNETIFDTRLGPINSGSDGKFIAFSTILPTPYFYGFSGGEGISTKGTLTYGVMNGFQNAEYPFYMALEESHSWHGVLLETSLPFMTQVLQAPGIAFHLEGSKADVNLHMFFGPTQIDVLEQLHSYLVEKLSTEEDNAPNAPYIPPYWGLGLHLCRQSANGSVALKDIYDLNEVINTQTGERKIPYDSDCIDGNLRIPFRIDYQHFSSEIIQNMTEFLLNEASKKIVFSQKITLPLSEKPDIKEIDEFLLMDKANMSDIQPFLGVIDNSTVLYLDVFHPNIFNNLSLWEFDFGDIPLSGLVLVDNYPRNEAIDVCKKPETFLQKLLQASNASQSVTVTDSDTPWGSICPNINHTLALLGENGESKTMKSHLEMHNTYGLQTMKKFRDIAVAEVDRGNGNLLLSSASGWTESLYYGAQNGMEVAFSWISLRDSLAHILRHFILTGVSGTPVCGSFLPYETPVVDTNLCLRWYQLSLLLPFAYHNYAHGNVSRGPLDFSQRYQNYLREAIRQRYTFAPYYYTLLKEYQTTLIPMIVPVSFHFYDTPGVDKSAVFKLLDQFMIGEGILAAPIVKPELNRETYFPPGVWYDSDGYVAWNNMTAGEIKIVTGHITTTPLFLRGGHIIPTLQDPVGNSIMESRTKEANYTLLVAILPNGLNKGKLYADFDNGNETLYHEVQFEVTTHFSASEIHVNTTISVVNMACQDFPYSSTIDQIKYLGFPNRFSNATISYEEFPDLTIPTVWGDELDYLRIRNVGFDWCMEDVAHINIVAFPVEEA